VRLRKRFESSRVCVSGSWRLDETYIKVQGEWRYLYRAVDKYGDTVDFLLTKRRDRAAALRFLRKAVGSNGTPESVTIDKSGSNQSALESFVEESGSQIEIRQSKYLNNMVEQDHRTVKRKMRAALGFKSFSSAKITIAGIEAMSIIRKGQVFFGGATTVSTFWAIFG
jgi:putative transposase